MIHIGISSLAWAQANLPEEMLKASFITIVPPAEDEEPNVNYHGMPFTHTAFLESITPATTGLIETVPSANHTAYDPFADLFALPNVSCGGMYELADVLDIMHADGVLPTELLPCDTRFDIDKSSGK